MSVSDWGAMKQAVLPYHGPPYIIPLLTHRKLPASHHSIFQEHIIHHLLREQILELPVSEQNPLQCLEQVL